MHCVSANRIVTVNRGRIDNATALLSSAE
jgi:hypothetical protein